VSDIEPSVMKVMDTYATAVCERDVAAFMRLYDRNARIYDAWDVWEYRGTEQWRRPIEVWLSSHASEKLHVTFEDVTAYGSQDCMVVSALVTYARISENGEKLGAILNRLTWSLQVRGGVARIAHEHTSVPVEFREMTPLLRWDRPTPC
jgi:ketosteroid isomerase-like protein